ncbi:MAG: hypothetical protein E3J65_05250 [Dehalococcoidia bacterium]|nr:MAG: hypothetical protein E3J65_05250 [Dehalococcoidia bacterium]
MGELKSAFEIAMERAKRLGEVSQEEVKKGDFVPEGGRLAARYLRGECNLIAELSKYDEEARGYVAEGAKGILLRNINLPRNDFAKGINRSVMEGIKALKADKGDVENVYSKIRRLFKHYEQEGEQQRSQAYEMLKREFQRELEQAAQQGGLSTRVEVESQPQFQEQWRRTLAQLDSQYQRLLEECKQELEGIP